MNDENTTHDQHHEGDDKHATEAPRGSAADHHSDGEQRFTQRHGGLLMAAAMVLGLLLLIALNMNG